ncbi:tetratricopeptide repeat protein [Cupriavidus malaysiensis]|uniref:Tetratricopeptide repeat protein n=1 Tax=Cupriavidus malaysiensis TaxID=367825 RepID=A0ABM6FF98_9BURK|nr:tetratricopeptide repeat protein [Cupriavidus malaysiensis]AOZ10584.1 hypothetical protein BKK80_34135 [Cupriavidus malaysiensis]
MQTYSLRDIERLLGIKRSLAAGLIRAGILAPERGARGEWRFSFQDMVLLRTAHSLRDSHIPRRRVIRALKRLHELRSDRPLSGLRLAAVGSHLAVREPHGVWHADTGQFLMDFEPDLMAPEVRDMPKPAAAASDDAVRWFEAGRAAEPLNPADAQTAYRRAIAEAPGYLDAYLNLGCLLCDAGHHGEAVELYRDALVRLGDVPHVYFNLAVALEDLGRDAEALSAYHRCIGLAPDFADAHFNVARLHQALGDAHRAIRHFNQYRRLEST